MLKQVIILLTAVFFSAFMISSFAVDCPKITNITLSNGSKMDGFKSYWKLFIPNDNRTTINGKPIWGGLIFLGKNHFHGVPTLSKYEDVMTSLTFLGSKQLKTNEKSAYKLRDGANYFKCIYNDEEAELKEGGKIEQSFIIFKTN